MSTPRVSVVMAVHNGAPWVSEAIASVLNQTLEDLEMVVIDDGSTDATPDLLASARDARLRVERRAHAGLTRSLNIALAAAQAPLVARLDADDVALPDRLERQRAFLDGRPEIGVVGTGAREVDSGGRVHAVVVPPAEDRDIRAALIRRNPIVHSSVMMRRDLVVGAGGYDETIAVAQDYELWMRLSGCARLANIPEPLVIRRLLPGRVSASRDGERLRTEAWVRWRALARGQYPWWFVVFVARPVLVLALPPPLRRLLRRMRR